MLAWFLPILHYYRNDPFKKRKRMSTATQCDKTWRNFATLAKCFKYLVIFQGLFSIWPFFNILWEFCLYIRHIFIVTSGQILEKWFLHLVTLLAASRNPSTKPEINFQILAPIFLHQKRRSSKRPKMAGRCRRRCRRRR